MTLCRECFKTSDQFPAFDFTAGAFKTCIQHSEKDVSNAFTLSPLQTLYTAIETEVNINPADIGDSLDSSIFSVVPCEGSCVVQTRTFVDAGRSGSDLNIF